MKTKSKEIIYLIAFALYCFMALSGGSELIVLNSIFKTIIYGIIILLLGYKVVVEGLSIKEILIYLIIGIICLLAYIKVDSIFFLINFVMIISIRGVNIKKVVKLDIIIKCVFLVTHIIIYIGNYFFAYDKFQELIINHGDRIRHAFYFTHPNIVSAIVFWIIMDLYYLKEKISVKHILISIILMLVNYYFTRSRTILILFIVFLIIFFVEKMLKNKEIFNRILTITYKFIFEIITIASIAMGILYKYNLRLITTVLNQLTSGRVYYSYAAFTDFGINLFSNANALKLEKYLFIDNFYVRCAVLYGLIFVVMISIMTKLSKSKNDKNIKEKIMIIILAISLFSEYFGIIIGNAIPLLLLGNLIMNKEENNEKKEPKDIYYSTGL